MDWHVLVKFWWVLAILLILVVRKFVFRLLGAVMIPQDSIGVVNKKFALYGKNRYLDMTAPVCATMDAVAGLNSSSRSRYTRRLQVCAPHGLWADSDKALQPGLTPRRGNSYRAASIVAPA